ncbi:MAG: hypothetical protein NZ578_13715, partial [Candidatus Binatia bacterium]|nr:hypothetical protein [Candidatus Binatia bacterium]
RGVPRFPPPPTPGVGKQLAQIVAEKDLFSPSRGRDVVDAQPTAAAVPPPAHLKLVGVLLVPGQEEAFFSDSSQGGKVIRLRKGETLGAYRLVQIMPLHATLALGQDGEEVNLPLMVVDSSTAAQAPRLIPPISRTPPQAALRAQVTTAASTMDETQAIRQSIQQLQRRLRQIRRQAARQAAESQEDPSQGESPPAEEDAEEEEE